MGVARVDRRLPAGWGLASPFLTSIARPNRRCYCVPHGATVPRSVVQRVDVANAAGSGPGRAHLDRCVGQSLDLPSLHLYRPGFPLALPCQRYVAPLPPAALRLVAPSETLVGGGVWSFLGRDHDVGGSLRSSPSCFDHLRRTDNSFTEFPAELFSLPALSVVTLAHNAVTTVDHRCVFCCFFLGGGAITF